ncbi:MAG TPA: histidinol-phosphate transaminase [Gemmatimonadaceae bacterium]|jgi:histidinol-phosphate aminotransferase
MTATPRVLARYEEARRGSRVDLSDNTNLWGSPPSVEKTISSVAGQVARYPSAYSDELKQSLAKYLAVEQSMLVTGCGSDDVLNSAIRALSTPGNRLAQIDPTFTMIRIFAEGNGLEVSDFDSDSSEAELTYLCSPNNPTGGVIDTAVIQSIVQRSSGVVIIDEAYIDFGGESSIPLLERYENVLITRTLSKAFGLAGFRVGYAVGSPDLICRVESARGPYKVNALAERVAVEVLSQDMRWVRDRADEAVRNRQRFAVELSQLGLEPLESFANFVLLPLSDASRVAEELLCRGISVRAFKALTGIGDALRITVGPWELMEPCLEALREICR